VDNVKAMEIRTLHKHQQVFHEFSRRAPRSGLENWKQSRVAVAAFAVTHIAYRMFMPKGGIQPRINQLAPIP
jgi:hypothetical protein